MTELIPESQFLEAKDDLAELTTVESVTYQTNTPRMWGEGRRLTVLVRADRVPPSVLRVLVDHDLGIANTGRDDDSGSIVVFCA